MDSPGGRGLALLVAATFFMENLDGTIVATAMPSMGRALGVPSAAVGITIVAYLVTLAGFIPVSGWVCDRWGARKTFLSALIGFTAASVLCAASTSLAELTVMRVLQGAAGALMVPVGRLVVLRVTAKTDLIRVIAYLTWPALAAPIIAPVLGGVCTTYLSWHWLFLINLPLGVLALLAAFRLVPEIVGDPDNRLDWLGFVLTGAPLAALLYAASLLGADNVRWAQATAAAGAGLLLGSLGVWHLARSPRPLIDLRVLRVPTFRLPHSSGALFRSAVCAVPVLLPLMFQDAFGWTPLRAGWMVTFVFIGNLAIKPVTSGLLHRHGFRTVITGATLGVAATMLLACLLTANTAIPAIAVLLTASGAFRSIGFTGYNTLAFADVTADQMTHANTLASTLQQLAQGFGVALAVLALRVGRIVGGASPESAYRIAFLVIAGLALLASVQALGLHREAGATLRIRPGDLGE